jgi:hypothetical protein
MTPVGGRLTMYGSAADLDPIEWGWVADQFAAAGIYWIVAATSDHPAARPVWGVWWEARLLLSIGSPRVRGAVGDGTPVTVHLGSGLDVVIVEGTVAGTTGEGAALAAYDAKYDWDYDLEQYGPLTVVAPRKVMAWRSAGRAGRDGFRAAGRWMFDQPVDPNVRGD